MTARSIFDTIVQNEALNFALTNRIPRRLLTSVVGRISKSENPFVYRPAMALWRMFSDLDLSDAKVETFKSLHACFTRELREGARTVDTRADFLTTPCDGIVVACGAIEGNQLLQVKGSHYTLANSPGEAISVATARAVRHAAPHGDDVSPVSRTVRRDGASCALRARRCLERQSASACPRARLYCRNERALLDFELAGGATSR